MANNNYKIDLAIGDRLIFTPLTKLRKNKSKENKTSDNKHKEELKKWKDKCAELLKKSRHKKQIKKSDRDFTRKEPLTIGYYKDDTNTAKGTTKVDIDTERLSNVFRDIIVSKASNGERVVFRDLIRLASQKGFIDKDSPKYYKALQEAYEFAIVKELNLLYDKYLLKSMQDSRDHRGQIFDEILSIYNNSPNLSTRTTDSVNLQQYSTPAPLVFLINCFIKIHTFKSALEPTAGNGILLSGFGSELESNTSKVVANELDSGYRLTHLQTLFSGVKNEVLNMDALQLNFPEDSFDLITMNPPFGKYNNKPITVKVNFKEFPIKKLEQAIAIHCLQFLKSNGIQVMVLGGHTLEPDYKYGGYKFANESDAPFLKYLYTKFKILKHIDINGDLYSKQGTKFDIRLIIIHKHWTDTNRPVPTYYGNNLHYADTWEDLYELLSATPHPNKTYKKETKQHEQTDRERNRQEGTDDDGIDRTDCGGLEERQRERRRSDGDLAHGLSSTRRKQPSSKNRGDIPDSEEAFRVKPNDSQRNDPIYRDFRRGDEGVSQQSRSDEPELQPSEHISASNERSIIDEDKLKAVERILDILESKGFEL